MYGSSLDKVFNYLKQTITAQIPTAKALLTIAEVVELLTQQGTLS